jgi:DNA-binding CsgD family transcriptional regulator
MLGFALLLVINAIVLCEGAFPFLPAETQTWEMTSAFHLMQSAAFGTTFLVGMFASRLLSRLARPALALVSMLPTLIGSSCLIAAHHLPTLALGLICAGALVLGAGCASLFVLWQRAFSTLSSPARIHALVVGAGLSVPLYLGLHLVSRAVMSLLIPLVLVPLCGLALILCMAQASRLKPAPQDGSRFAGEGVRAEDRVSRLHVLLRQRYLLSAREVEVVELVTRGNSVASIAERLVVTENTIRTHMKRIYRKLAIHKRQELLNLLELLE